MECRISAKLKLSSFYVERLSNIIKTIRALQRDLGLYTTNLSEKKINKYKINILSIPVHMDYIISFFLPVAITQHYVIKVLTPRLG